MIRYRRVEADQHNVVYYVELAAHGCTDWDTYATITKGEWDIPKRVRWAVEGLGSRTHYCRTLADAKTCVEAWIIRAAFTAKHLSNGD